MSHIKILAVFVIAMFSLQVASIDDVVLDGTLKQETVEFTIQNLGSSPAVLSWIIIQDDVLLMTGSGSVNPGEVNYVQVARNHTGVQKYKMVVTDQLNTTVTKEHLVQ